MHVNDVLQKTDPESVILDQITSLHGTATHNLVKLFVTACHILRLVWFMVKLFYSLPTT